jgi:hypothetical protein
MDLVQALLASTQALRGAAIDYAICGGIAVTLHGATRSTRDIDLLVEPERIDAALDALRPLGWKFAARPMTFDAGSPTERQVQRVTRIEGKQALSIDLIAASGFLSPVFAGREQLQTPGGPLCVVSRQGLALMKRAAGRPQDLADLQKLGLAGG